MHNSIISLIQMVQTMLHSGWIEQRRETKKCLKLNNENLPPTKS